METTAQAAQSAPLLGFWYPALLSKAVRPGRMQAQTLLGIPLIICRDSQGRSTALRDLCPHRAMPLLLWRFDGVRLECPYHGWQFDMDDRCRHTPALVDDGALHTRRNWCADLPCPLINMVTMCLSTYPIDRAYPPHCQTSPSFQCFLSSQNVLRFSQISTNADLHHRPRHYRVDGPGPWPLCAPECAVAQPNQHASESESVQLLPGSLSACVLTAPSQNSAPE